MEEVERRYNIEITPDADPPKKSDTIVKTCKEAAKETLGVIKKYKSYLRSK